VRKYLPILVICAALYYGWDHLSGRFDLTNGSTTGTTEITNAIREQRSGVQISGEGVVVKVLADDNDGSRHQRFILRLASGQILLIAHNIDLAPRISPLGAGDTVVFFGVYEWNPQGGVIHWTHHDPNAQHQGGWLKHNGQTFQ